MSLIQAIIWYPVSFVVMLCVIIGAVMTGKKLRDRKDAKNSEENNA